MKADSLSGATLEPRLADAGGLRPRGVQGARRTPRRPRRLSFRQRRSYPTCRSTTATALRAAARPRARKEIMAEWVEAMTEGPGIIAFRGAFADHAPIDAATEHFWAIIERAASRQHGGGDHFAKPGANDRIWNALEKLCLRDPAGLRRLLRQRGRSRWSARPGSGPPIRSPRSSMSSIRAARRNRRIATIISASRPPEEIERFPAHVHRLSPVLTLQGAVAHCDMPLETGPTLYLPFSQSYLPGYLRRRSPNSRTISRRITCSCRSPRATRCSSIPALFHAAGTNRSKDVAGSPICCKSHRPTAARWRASTARDGHRALSGAAPRRREA